MVNWHLQMCIHILSHLRIIGYHRANGMPIRHEMGRAVVVRRLRHVTAESLSIKEKLSLARNPLLKQSGKLLAMLISNEEGNASLKLITAKKKRGGGGGRIKF